MVTCIHHKFSVCQMQWVKCVVKQRWNRLVIVEMTVYSIRLSNSRMNVNFNMQNWSTVFQEMDCMPHPHLEDSSGIISISTAIQSDTQTMTHCNEALLVITGITSRIFWMRILPATWYNGSWEIIRACAAYSIRNVHSSMSTLGWVNTARGGVLVNVIAMQSDNRAVPGTVIQLRSHLVMAFCHWTGLSGLVCWSFHACWWWPTSCNWYVLVLSSLRRQILHRIRISSCMVINCASM